MKKQHFFFLFLWLPALQLQAQGVHAHNDYEHLVPFWMALSAGCTSLEADVFLEKGKILVAHNKEDLKPDRDLETLYLKPLQQVLQGNGQVIKTELQLLIDLKTEAYSTLAELVTLLEAYPELTGNPRVKFVISGNRPKPGEYSNYPDFIFFDFQQSDATPVNLHKVALVSLPFGRFSKWNGKGRLTDQDQKKLKPVIEFAHGLGKPVRFWGTPDSPTAWYTFAGLGVDYINTDKPFEACRYLFDLPQRMVKFPEREEEVSSGFEKGKKGTGRSVILMIGDGNGLAQISAGMIAARDQTNFSRFKHIGLVNTSSADDLVTDSAAGATAMATGRKTKNRYIGVDENGQKLRSVMDCTREYSHGKILNGIITTDEITGATPAAFFGHVMDRDSTAKLASQLESSAVDWFIAGGRQHFKNNGLKIYEELPRQKIDFPAGVLAAEGLLPYISDGRGDYLIRSLAYTLRVFEDQPFFLLVENGHIDGAGHANEAGKLVDEVLDFDRAIGAAMDYVDAHPETLLIVTADHETGGVSIPHGDAERVELAFQGDDHTGIKVPLFAYGAGAGQFSGFLDNTAVFDLILAYFGIRADSN